MNKKIALGPAIAMMAIVAAVTFAITVSFTMSDFNGRMQNLRERELLYEQIAEIDRLTRQNYYGDIDNSKLLNAVAKGYVNGLEDKYAMYLTAEEYKQQMQNDAGKSADIGVDVITDPSGYIKVVEVYPDSSAASSGILVGDLIVKIDDTDITTQNSVQMRSAMKGEAGTTINIVIRRDANDIELEVTRRKVEVPMIVAKKYNSVGYIKIKEFSNSTPVQFETELKKLLAENVGALIFDVRGNPGGTIESVAAVLDILLPEGDLVSATYKSGTTQVLAYSDTNEINLPMVVLTNGKTASAAELFAQAIKDYNKGRTVGTQTFGKGVMQSIYPLSNGAALDITVAKYNPPKSANFDGVGVKPDYEVKLTPELERILYELDENDDAQLRKAIELANAAMKTGGFDGLSEKHETSSSQKSSSEESGDDSTGENSDEGSSDESSDSAAE